MYYSGRGPTAIARRLNRFASTALTIHCSSSLNAIRNNAIAKISNATTSRTKELFPKAQLQGRGSFSPT
jgi:hypothetical protein